MARRSGSDCVIVSCWCVECGCAVIFIFCSFICISHPNYNSHSICISYPSIFIFRPSIHCSGSQHGNTHTLHFCFAL